MLNTVPNVTKTTVKSFNYGHEITWFGNGEHVLVHLNSWISNYTHLVITKVKKIMLEFYVLGLPYPRKTRN